MPISKRAATASFAIAVSLSASVARADIVLSANDAHTVMVDGSQVAAKNSKPDTLSVIDVKGKPRVLATIEVPASVVGPPTAVWIAPDESWAIATGATKVQAGAPGGIGPNDQVSVIDLTSTPPRLSQSLTSGAGATTIRVSPDGTLALLANRTEGTLSVYTIKDQPPASRPTRWTSIRTAPLLPSPTWAAGTATLIPSA